MATNTNLGNARKAKKDEFYTQWVEIEKEMNAYLDFDPNAFKDKVVLLPCDDPEWSNFTKFFALRFTELGIKKLISTAYAPKSNMNGEFYTPQPSLFDFEQYDEVKDFERGKIFTLERKDVNGDGKINIEDIQWEYLEGDGDFRSEEITNLRDESDMVITNPPFSLFREFIAWCVDGDVEFSIIGNMNALTYKEVFPLFRDNKCWYGSSIHSGDREFRVPENYPLSAAGHRTDSEGNRYIRVKGVRWFTNIEHGRRHEPMPLMTMEDNKRFNKKIAENSTSYKQYDNYDAIEIPITAAIPSDYGGLMGVPISFFDRYSPEQFEILGITQSWDDSSGLKKRIYPQQVQIQKTGKRSKVSKLNDGAAIPVSTAPDDETYYLVDDETFVKPYCRILIRHRQVNQES